MLYGYTVQYVIESERSQQKVENELKEKHSQELPKVLKSRNVVFKVRKPSFLLLLSCIYEDKSLYGVSCVMGEETQNKPTN